MKQTKWLISLWACLVLMAASSAGVKGKLAIPCQAWEQGSIDTIPLPSRIYSIGKEVDSIQSPSSLQSFFDELDSLGAGKDTVLTIVHLGDSHIQAGYYSGKVMRLLQAQFGNAGRGWIAPFKLSKTNEPDDYFISSSVREWVTGRCIQANKKCPVGIGGIGIQSVSPSINLDVRIAPNNGAGYSFNQAILYRGEKAMPMLPAGSFKDSIQTSLATVPAVAGVLADTFRISHPVDTLQLHSTRRKQGTDKLLPASNLLWFQPDERLSGCPLPFGRRERGDVCQLHRRSIRSSVGPVETFFADYFVGYERNLRPSLPFGRIWRTDTCVRFPRQETDA